MVHNLRFEEQQDGQRLHSLLLTCMALDIDIISHDPAAFKQPTKSKAAPLSELHSSYPQAPEFQCQPPKRQSSKRQTISPSSSLRKMHCEPSDPAAFSLVFCFSPNTLHRSTHLSSARSQIVPSLLNQIPLSLPPPLLASHLTPMSSLSI
jgi:hypothetical protein